MGRVGRGSVVGLLALALAAPPAQAKVLASVEMPDSLPVQGKAVALRRMALKEKLFFDIYVWGLYLEHEARSSAEAVAADGIRRLHFRMLRSLSREQLVDGIRESLGASPGMQAGPMREALERFVEALREVRHGDDLVITYVPREGTYISGTVKADTFIPGKAFADALFQAWLEDNPL